MKRFCGMSESWKIMISVNRRREAGNGVNGSPSKSGAHRMFKFEHVLGVI